MSYAVNWITKVITIPSADLTLVSGTRYSLSMTDFLSEIRRLEASPDDGLWADQILDHTNAKTLSGATFAPMDEIINGYTIQISGAATRVDLLGSNNNIVDVMIATGVSVVPSNSAGLQIVAVGSGVTEQDKTDIINGTGARVVEGTYTADQLLRIMASALAGQRSGIGTATETYTGLDGATQRIILTPDAQGNGTPTINGAP